MWLSRCMYKLTASASTWANVCKVSFLPPESHLRPGWCFLSPAFLLGHGWCSGTLHLSDYCFRTRGMTKKMYLLFTISQCSAGVIDSSSCRAPNAELKPVFLFQGVPWNNGTHGDWGKPLKGLIKTVLAVAPPLFPKWSPALRGTYMCMGEKSWCHQKKRSCCLSVALKGVVCSLRDLLLSSWN